jgi:hypothetical protein
MIRSRLRIIRYFLAENEEGGKGSPMLLVSIYTRSIRKSEIRYATIRNKTL